MTEDTLEPPNLSALSDEKFAEVVESEALGKVSGRFALALASSVESIERWRETLKMLNAETQQKIDTLDRAAAPHVSHMAASRRVDERRRLVRRLTWFQQRLGATRRLLHLAKERELDALAKSAPPPPARPREDPWPDADVNEVMLAWLDRWELRDRALRESVPVLVDALSRRIAAMATGKARALKAEVYAEREAIQERLTELRDVAKRSHGAEERLQDELTIARREAYVARQDRGRFEQELRAAELDASNARRERTQLAEQNAALRARLAQLQDVGFDGLRALGKEG